MSNYKRYFNNSSNPAFLTFVTYNRNKILIPNIDIFRDCLKFAKSKYDFEIIAISILKEHCHIIISADDANNIPKIIRTIQYDFSVKIPEMYVCKNLSLSALKRGEKGAWQRRYYDHVTRNKNDLMRHIDYIHFNSMKHYKILPKDWKYSSFNKFVKEGYYEINWCNIGDKYNINNVDYE